MLNTIPISTAMTREVLTLKPLDTFDHAKQLFEENSIHHLPVVDEQQKVLGIISKSDYFSLCDRFTLFSEALSQKVNNTYFSSLLAKEVMHKSPVCLNETSSMSFALGIFQENLFHAIPVINDKKELVGILSTLDLLNYMSQALEGKVQLLPTQEKVQ